MKIQKEKQAGLNFNEFNKQRIIRERFSQIDAVQGLSDELRNDSKSRIEKTISEEGSLFYLPSKTVMDLSSRVKVDINAFDYKFFNSIKDKKITFLLGDKFYRWTKTPNKINVLAVYQQAIPEHMKKFYPSGVTHDMAYVFFAFDTQHGVLSFPPNPAHPFSEETVLEFVRLLIFTELSPIETKVLSPNQSIGTRRAGKYRNESNRNVIIVDSTWNTHIEINEAFLVSGHFRMQACGKNWSERELIWVSGFQKKGYHRKPKGDNF